MPPSFVSSTLQENEKKVQKLSLDTMEGSVSFFNELDMKKKTVLEVGFIF